jgi:hypothetical protein
MDHMNLLKGKVTIVTFLWITLLGLATAQNFAPATNYPTGMLPDGSTSADFNNDGNIDVVVGNSGTTTFSLFLGRGDGSLAPSSTIQLGLHPLALAAADFNGDGKIDIAVTGIGGPFFQVLFGNGDGTFQAPVDITVPGLPSNQVAPFDIGDISVGDLNADKSIDIAVATSNGVAVFLNDGAGNFSFAGNVMPGNVVQNLALADINRDGTLDLVVMLTSGAQNTFLSLGKGDGTFQTPSPLPIATVNPDGMAVADLNNDGLPDIIVDDNGAPGSNAGSIQIALQKSDGSFTAAGSLVIPGPTGVVAVDLDGDGNIDIAATTGTVNGNQDFVEVFRGRGDGTFSAPALFPVASGVLHPITAHLTNTAAMDLISSATTPSEISVLVNHGANTLKLQSSLNPSAIGQPVTLSASVNPTFPGSGAFSGSLIFAEGSKTLGTSLVSSSGTGSLNTIFSTVGNHALKAVFSGNPSFVSSSASITQVVNKAVPSVALSSSINPSLFGQSVTFSITVSGIAGTSTPSGTVNLLDGSSIVLSGTLDNAGKTALSTSSLAVSSHLLTAQYAGDANYASASSSPLAQTVNKNASSTTLASTPNPSGFGQGITLTANVTGPAGTSGTPTGSVTFNDGTNAIGNSNLDSNGRATLLLSSLSVGTHSISAAYPGDANFSGSTSAIVSQAVNQASTTTTLNASPNPSTFGQSVSLSAAVIAQGSGGIPTGRISFSDGAAALGAATLDNTGKALLSVSALSVGSHSIVASYSGDNNFSNSASSVVSQVVNRAASVTTFTANPNPSAFGQPVALTASVVASGGASAIPTGAVTFTDGTSALGAATIDSTGKAVFAASSLSVGVHSITANYSGDGNFSTSTSSPVSQTVSKSSTATALAASPDPSVFGQLVVLTATVAASGTGAGIPTGSVTFADGVATIGTGALDKTGKATFTVSSLSVGTHNISANYGGDGNFNSSTASGAAGVNQVVSQSNTVTAISSSADPNVFGQSITLTASVTASGGGSGAPSGSVTFMDGTVAIGTALLDTNGNAALIINSLGVGTHNITATYPGSGSYLPSRSGNLSQTVNRDSVLVALTSVPNPSTFGQAVTFTVKVVPSPPGGVPGTAIPSGTITFSDGTSVLGSTILDNTGTVIFTINTLTAGSHAITASYGGDANFSRGSSSPYAQTVKQVATSTSLTTSMNPITNTTVLTLAANVQAIAGAPTGSVVFFDGSHHLGSSQIDGLGNAVLSVSSLSTGSHTLFATYGGDNNFASSQSSPFMETVLDSRKTIVLTSSANPQTVTKAVTFSATVTTAVGGPVSGGAVTFANGASFLATVLVTNSRASFTTKNLPVGNDSITAVYQAGPSPGPADGSATLVETINPATPVVVGGGNDEDFTLSVKPGQAQVKAGSTVSAQIALVPVNGLTGVVNISCTGVPQGSACAIKPNGATFDGKNPIRATLVVTTSGPGAPPRRPYPPRGRKGGMAWLPLLPIAFGCVVVPTFKRKKGSLVAVTLLTALLAGCSGSTFQTVPLSSNTPPGNYKIIIQAVAGPLAHSTQMQLKVR